jgi:hypothetical protein
MSALSPTARVLVQQMAQAPRGPRRNGWLALWLALRLIEDLQLDPPQAERIYRRRVALLEGRLSSLTVPPPLNRALRQVTAALASATRGDGGRILSLLVSPAREALGGEAGEALGRAAKYAAKGEPR